MQAQSTFQKYFFALIFIVTILMFAQMYLTHQENLAQVPTLERTRILLDVLSGAQMSDSARGLAQGYQITPSDGPTIDSARALLAAWGREARIDNYAPGGTDSGFTDKIQVFYPPPLKGPDPLAPEVSRVAIEVIWTQKADSMWLVKLLIIPRIVPE